MTRFVCSKCGYILDSSKESAPKICPYCNSPGSVHREKTAKELLEEQG